MHQTANREIICVPGVTPYNTKVATTCDHLNAYNVYLLIMTDFQDTATLHNNKNPHLPVKSISIGGEKKLL